MTKHCFARYILPVLLTFICLPTSAQVLEAISIFDDTPGTETPTSFEISADGRHMYVVSPSEGLISAFARDIDSGGLSLINTAQAAAPISGLITLTQAELTADGRFLYLGGSCVGDLMLYERNLNNGEITLIDPAVTNTTSDEELCQFAVSADGANLYALSFNNADNSGIDSRLVVYAINNDGSLELLETFAIDAQLDIKVLVSPDDRHVYFASNVQGLLFERDAATGRLTFLSIQTALQGITPASRFSNDGLTIYTQTSVQQDPPASLLQSRQRDPATGNISFGLNEANIIATNNSVPDDTFAFASDDRLLVTNVFLVALRVIAQQGGFVRLETDFSNVSFPNGSMQIFAVAFSPDEAFLYAGIQGGGILILRNNGINIPSEIPSVPALGLWAQITLLLLLVAGAWVALKLNQRRTLT